MVQKKTFFGYKTPVLKKTAKIDVSTFESEQQVGVSGNIPSGF